MEEKNFSENNLSERDNKINLDAVAIVEQLFSQLNEREKDILKRRFGMAGAKRETLESIGDEHKLTRERVRQIEASGINKIKKYKEIETVLADLKKMVANLLEDHGGILDKEYLFDILLRLLAVEKELNVEKKLIYRNNFDFLISKVLDKDFNEVKNHKDFNPFFKSEAWELAHLEELASELLNKVKEAEKLFGLEELIEFIKELPAYKKHEDKLQTGQNIDLTTIFGDNDNLSTIQEYKPLYSLLMSLSDIEPNKFAEWGHTGSREVKPKTINDKIYLILKHEGKPMYYGDIAKKIQEMGFDKKLVNPATTHNELILDDKYVLVGRGMYGLKEWGYRSGAVIDVIKNILQDSKDPMTKKEIMNEVLKQRMVKETTINLALMNKSIFEKVDGNKYKLKA